MSTTATRTAASPVLPSTANLIEAVRLAQRLANAAENQHHAIQADGHAYGDLHVTMRNLLALAYGEDAGTVYDYMIDSGEDAAYCAAYLVQEREREAASDARAAALDAAWTWLVDRALVSEGAAYDDDDLLARYARHARCEENAQRGTGTGACDRPLDAHGACDRAAQHVA